MLKDKKSSRVVVRRGPAGRAGRGDGARVGSAPGGVLDGEAVREILSRGDAREMRRTETRMRKWLEGTRKLVEELEQIIVVLEGPKR